MQELVKMGLVGVAESFGLHFLLRDDFKDLAYQSWHCPAASTLYIWIDFKEHDTVGMGPIETGSMWYSAPTKPSPPDPEAPVRRETQWTPRSSEPPI